MFGSLKGTIDGLKEGARKAGSDAVYRSAAEALAPKVAPILEKVGQMAPAVVANDEKYDAYVIEPAWLAVASVTGGITSLVPNLHERFAAALRHARTELLVIDVDNNRVSLAEGALERLPQVLVEGLSQPTTK
jgi:hypothetical protein